jgi:hypothetical protein
MNRNGREKERGFMRRTSGGIQAIIFVCFVIGLVLTAQTDANAATWYKTHGNSASVQDENNPLIVKSCVRKGTGLELVLQSDAAVDFMTTWVNFAVPTPFSGSAGPGARYFEVRVNMVLAGAYSSIPTICVYNGETLVKTFTVNYRGAGWHTIPLDLGRVQRFSKGLGISVQVSQDFNAVKESFAFSEAGAYFVP